MTNTDNLPKDKRAKIWTVVIYEDSCPDWLQKLRDMRLKCLVSPLHSMDVSADGEAKKPHRHVIIFFPSKKSEKQVQEISDNLSGVKVMARECLVRDARGAVRYLVHADDPNKAQYPIEEIISLGGADLLDYFNDASDVDTSVGEMMDWLDNDEYASFSRLARYARDNRPDWFRTITSKRTLFLKTYAQAVTYERRCKATDELLTGSMLGFPDERSCKCSICGRPTEDYVFNHRGEAVWTCDDHKGQVLKLLDENIKFLYGKEL